MKKVYQLLTMGGGAYILQCDDLKIINDTLEKSKFIQVGDVLIATHQVIGVCPVGSTNKQESFKPYSSSYAHLSAPTKDKKRSISDDRRMGLSEPRREDGISSSKYSRGDLQLALSKITKRVS